MSDRYSEMRATLAPLGLAAESTECSCGGESSRRVRLRASDGGILCWRTLRASARFSWMAP
eukprot:3756656-Heterocapsa_arctica.AAC.1